MNLAQCTGDYVWSHLHTLGLEGMTISEDDVVSFLSRHACTLKRLQLGVYRYSSTASTATATGTATGTAVMENVIVFQQGTFKRLLARTREVVKLEKLNLKGEVMEMDSPVRYNYGLGLYDDEWARVPDAGNVAAQALAAERFMIQGEEWDDVAMGLVMMDRVVGDNGDVP
jgi:hypothetical protein